MTGANGYLGQGIVNDLVVAGNEVIATDFSLKHVNEAVKKVACDIFELEDPYTFLNKPDVLLHLAWRDGFMHYSDAHIVDLPKHYLFIKRMLAAGIKKVAVMGSMHEIGLIDGCIRDDTPCSPMSLYGISKNALRNIVKELAEQNNVDFQWLRGFYIVGSSQNGSSVFSKITAAILEEKKNSHLLQAKISMILLTIEIFAIRFH